MFARQPFTAFALRANFEKPPPAALVPSPQKRSRAAEQQIEVVAQPATVHGFESFFVRGPDGLLIELVQAAPNAELCPTKRAARKGA